MFRLEFNLRLPIPEMPMSIEFIKICKVGYIGVRSFVFQSGNPISVLLMCISV